MSKSHMKHVRLYDKYAFKHKRLYDEEYPRRLGRNSTHKWEILLNEEFADELALVSTPFRLEFHF
ncbi:MAG: hypothetical protein HEQ32_03280 [Vampirovibrio sp.]